MQRGFTLIELLIVIAILAVLAVAVVLVLNPAELLRQGRDSRRLSDLAAINKAIAIYLADVTGSSFSWSATTTCTFGTLAPQGAATTTCVTNNSNALTGTGWVNLNFTTISTGSPLPKLPIDPVNSTTTGVCTGTPSGCFYVYKSTSTIGRYKLYANMESAKFAASGTSDVESTDGGNSPSWYEIGSDMTL
jgi:prepilin-type N-terminal cleavage/methylation domain-containing protein